MTAATPALLARARKHLFVAVVSDTLDNMGMTGQALAPSIRPLDEALTFLGRARTGMYREMFHVQPGNPYELEIKLIDDLRKDEVAVLACSGNPRIAPWGELLSTASKARGAAACVTVSSSPTRKPTSSSASHSSPGASSAKGSAQGSSSAEGVRTSTTAA